MKQFSSPHVCKVDFVKQTPEVTAALIRDLKSQAKDWKRNYKVKTSTCTRDLKGLAIVVAHSQEDELKRGVDVDLLVDRPVPAVPGGEHDDVDGDPVGQLVPDPEEPVQPVLGPVVANPEEQNQPEQVPGQPAQLQPEVPVSAWVLKTVPRKKAIRERWIMKQ